MTTRHPLTVVATLGVLAFVAAACTPANNEAEAPRDTQTTTIIEREVPSAPVVIERQVAVPTPPVVIERDRNGDTTTVRAGRNGIEVETTNR